MCKTRNARLLHMNMVLSNGETGATVRLNSPSIYQTNVESFRELESLLTRVFFSGSTSTISLGVKNQNNHSPLHTCVNIINCTRKCVSFFHFQFHFISIIAFSVIDDKSRHLWRLNNILWSLRIFFSKHVSPKEKGPFDRKFATRCFNLFILSIRYIWTQTQPLGRVVHEIVLTYM